MVFSGRTTNSVSIWFSVSRCGVIAPKSLEMCLFYSNLSGISTLSFFEVPAFPYHENTTVRSVLRYFFSS